MIKIENIWHSYMLGSVEVQALKNINFEIADKQMVALIGPSGSGKTTLLNLIGSLDVPTKGTIYVDDHDINRMTKKEVQIYRQKTVSFVFQFFNLFPTLTLQENIEFPLLFSKVTKKDIENQVTEALSMVGLEGMGNRRIQELSGGQRQRVAVARSLVMKSKIVLADEPTGNLDGKTAAEVMGFFSQINEKTGTTFIFSTHDPRIMQYAHQIIKLKDGEIDSIK